MSDADAPPAATRPDKIVVAITEAIVAAQSGAEEGSSVAWVDTTATLEALAEVAARSAFHTKIAVTPVDGGDRCVGRRPDRPELQSPPEESRQASFRPGAQQFPLVWNGEGREMDDRGQRGRRSAGPDLGVPATCLCGLSSRHAPEPRGSGEPEGRRSCGIPELPELAAVQHALTTPTGPARCSLTRNWRTAERGLPPHEMKRTRMNRILATVALALAVGAPGIAYANSADAAFAAELKTGPCFAKPPVDDVTGLRMALIAMGMSIEESALGASKNPSRGRPRQNGH